MDGLIELFLVILAGVPDTTMNVSPLIKRGRHVVSLIDPFQDVGSSIADRVRRARATCYSSRTATTHAGLLLGAPLTLLQSVQGGKFVVCRFSLCFVFSFYLRHFSSASSARCCGLFVLRPLASGSNPSVWAFHNE